MYGSFVVRVLLILVLILLLIHSHSSAPTLTRQLQAQRRRPRRPSLLFQACSPSSLPHPNALLPSQSSQPSNPNQMRHLLSHGRASTETNIAIRLPGV